LADFYVDLFKQFSIYSKKVVATDARIPLYALIVEGDFGLYYLDPINDLFHNQYHLRPDFFAVIPRSSSLKDQYPNLVQLDFSYCKRLDHILGFSKYYDDAFFIFIKILLINMMLVAFFLFPEKLL